MSTFETEILDGRYRVESELGRGGMGVVYRGTQLALDRPVAIKRLLETHDPASVARFHREAIATGRLAHPGIVQILDAGIDRGEPYLVMELVEGEPLDEHLAQRGALPVDEALAIAWQIADALASAHAAGILHRDVKPANVMVGRDGRARLLDFGLAMLAHAKSQRLTQFGAFVGTPEYLAPEVSRGEEPDARADVYALGATLYELLTGNVPFEGPNAMATVLAHFTDPLVSPSRRAPGIPIEVDAVVATLLARDASERPSSAGVALALLDAAMHRLDRPTKSPPRAAETAPPSARELDAVLLAALAGD